MKKLLSLLLVAGIVTFVSCDAGKKEREAAAREEAARLKKIRAKRIKDSLVYDSICKKYDTVLVRWKKEENIKDKEMRGKVDELEKIYPSWSYSDCEGVINNKIWIGMSINMLKYERGEPNSANPSNYGNGVQWQWCWDYKHPSCFYGGKDGIITAYN